MEKKVMILWLAAVIQIFDDGESRKGLDVLLTMPGVLSNPVCVCVPLFQRVKKCLVAPFSAKLFLQREWKVLIGPSQIN